MMTTNRKKKHNQQENRQVRELCITQTAKAIPTTRELNFYEQERNTQSGDRTASSFVDSSAQQRENETWPDLNWKYNFQSQI